MKQSFLLTFFMLFFSLTIAKANIIRDSEIEETINLIVEPLKKASGIKDLKIHIIDNPIPNAFTIGGNEIFIHSGLIITFPDPDVLRGIIAHEIGHILGNHTIRQQEIIENYTKAALGATALGLATAISGNTGPGMAIVLGGTHFSERSVFAYSRAFESSADQTAIRLLEKSSHSSIGMIKFFKKMRIHTQGDFFNPYDQTHPLSQERLLILQDFNKKSKYSKSQNDEDLIYKYKRSSVKLAAFTQDLNKIIDCSYEENTDELTHYIKAIKCFRKGNFDDAVNHVNKLLMLRPNDPYYHELKGQIFFEAGKKPALFEYTAAAQIKPDDILIKLGRAVVGITQYKDEPEKMLAFYKDLIYITEKEPDNLLALFYLAIYYEKKGLVGKSYLNSAIIAYKSGNKKNALLMAKAAIKALPENSPDWYKASDIVTESE